jgi:hypothetical protein
MSRDRETGELVATITLTGAPDIYRFAHGMCHLQCEFALEGYSLIAKLQRRYGRRFSLLLQHLGGGRWQEVRGGVSWRD